MGPAARTQPSPAHHTTPHKHDRCPQQQKASWTQPLLRVYRSLSNTCWSLALALLSCCVQVLMLVWDDQTNNYGLHSGVMATHDQETLNYFKGTAVTCVLCPRQGSEEDSYLTVNTDMWLAL